jgi:hypothetical protein
MRVPMLFRCCLCKIVADDTTETGLALENVAQSTVSGCSGGSGALHSLTV